MKTLLSKIIINLLIYTSKIGTRLSYNGFNHGQNRGFLACVQDIFFHVSCVKAEKIGDCRLAQATGNPDTFKSSLWCKTYLLFTLWSVVCGSFLDNHVPLVFALYKVTDMWRQIFKVDKKQNSHKTLSGKRSG